MDKPREIEAKVGRIRPASRDTYDYRAQTAIPSATGGRPATGGGVLAAATGNEVPRIGNQPPPDQDIRPLGDINSLMAGGQLRYAKKPQSFLPTVSRLNRSLEEYTINNADMVNITASYLDRLSEKDPNVLTGFTDSFEAAQWAIAEIQRSYEPGTSSRMVDMIHQSRSGRQVYQYLRQIEEALNGE